MKKMKSSSMKNLAVTLLILALATSVSPSPVAAEPQKVVFRRVYNYSPPPVGHWNFFISGTISLLSVVQESLTHYYPANGSYVPGLAVSWTYEDYMVFTLKLREGVKWHDGTDFTAKDVWATWHNIYLLKDRAWYYLKNITIVDDHTLVFYMKEKNDYCPFYILWHWCVNPYSQYGALAEKVYAKIQEGYDIMTDATPFTDLVNELKEFRPPKPIGTGPYKFKSISETELVLEKFVDYWKGVPYIDEVQYVRVLTADVMWTMLAAGQFSWHWAIPTKEQHELMVGQPWVKIIPVARPVGVTIYFNSREVIGGAYGDQPNPLRLKEVRQAIAYAIDRAEIALIQYPAGGTAQKYNVGFNNAALYATLNSTFIDTWLKDFTYDYNTTKAEKILKDLGCTKDTDGIYKLPAGLGGTRLDFEIKAAGWLDGPALEAIAAELALVGIKITPRVVDSAVYWAVDGDFYQGRFQIGVGVFGGADFSFDEYYHKYLHLYPGHGFPVMQSVPWRTDPVNITYLTKYMQTYPAQATLEERNEFRAILSYITASQVPVLTMFTPTAYMYANVEQFGGWPAETDLYWQGLGSYEAHGSSYLHRWLLLKPNFDLTISVSPAVGGTTSPAAGTYAYAVGDTVQVTATAASGYTFKNWLLDGVSVSGATITVTMDVAHTLAAVFEATSGLTILVAPAGGGTTSPAAGTYAYAVGDTVQVTATAASGYTFKNWLLDGVSVSGATITVTMDVAHTLAAVFEAIPPPPYELYAGVIIAVVAVIVVVYFVLRRR